VRELLAVPGISAERLGVFEIDSPAIDFYAGRPVPSYLDVIPRTGLMGVGPRTIGDLRNQLIAGSSEAVLLVRATQPPGQDPVTAQERLRATGLDARPLPLRSRYRIDNGRTEVIALRVQPSQTVTR
jgi:hypothetical protein